MPKISLHLRNDAEYYRRKKLKEQLTAAAECIETATRLLEEAYGYTTAANDSLPERIQKFLNS